MLAISGSNLRNEPNPSSGNNRYYDANVTDANAIAAIVGPICNKKLGDGEL